MTIGIIDPLEIINIANCKTAILKAQLGCCFFQISTVVQPCEGIVISNLQKTFILLF